MTGLCIMPALRVWSGIVIVRAVSANKQTNKQSKNNYPVLNFVTSWRKKLAEYKNTCICKQEPITLQKSQKKNVILINDSFSTQFIVCTFYGSDLFIFIYIYKIKIHPLHYSVPCFFVIISVIKQIQGISSITQWKCVQSMLKILGPIVSTKEKKRSHVLILLILLTHFLS